MINRLWLLLKIKEGLKDRAITALLGPRQCGKTTLARQIAKQEKGIYFDLEDPLDLARLQNPQLALNDLKGVVMLDEIQRRPDLLPLLRVLADRRPLRCRFLILGSASPDLMKYSSESLAGRIHFVDMNGFSISEVGKGKQSALWLRGGFPDSFLAKTDVKSWIWREDFIRTFLERDIPQLGIQVPAVALRRFWTMIAHYHAQIWNGSEIAASLGVAHTTTRRYLDLLSGAFIVRQLPPWFENVGKRVVKTPKIYIRDSGLLHSLLNLPDKRSLESHPKYGASWEGFALEQILTLTGERNAYFWKTHAGAELDLLLFHKGKRLGFEFKCSDAPGMTKSMHMAIQDLKLHRLWVIYPGKTAYSIHKKVQCIGLGDLNKSLQKIGSLG